MCQFFWGLKIAEAPVERGFNEDILAGNASDPSKTFQRGLTRTLTYSVTF